MEKIKPEDINDPTNSPFVQMTVLNNLLKKIYSDVSIHFSEDLVRCCLIPKVNDTNKVYLEKVEQCFVNWKHKAQVPIQKLKNMAIFCRDLQQNLQKKTLNCYNLVSESEIELCYNQEQKQFVQELGSFTREFLQDFEKNHKID